MLMEYKGKRFRVSERTYYNFENQHPERAACLKKIKEAEEYYNYDKLLQIIEPPENQTKKIITKNYEYAQTKYDEATMKLKTNDMDKYFGAKEMARKIGIELINYDPEKTITEILKEHTGE